MFINPVHLIRCLERVAALEECYKLNMWHGDEPYRSVDYLIELCNNFDGRPTSLIKLPLNAVEMPVQGMFLKLNDGTAVVVYAEGLLENQERFVICKELMHGVLDMDEYHNMDIEGHVQAMRLEFPDPESKPAVPVQVEFLAEVAAMEFLFPHRYRKHVVANGKNYAAAAATFGVPQLLVEQYCSPSWMEHLDIGRIKALG